MIKFAEDKLSSSIWKQGL